MFRNNFLQIIGLVKGNLKTSIRLSCMSASLSGARETNQSQEGTVAIGGNICWEWFWNQIRKDLSVLLEGYYEYITNKIYIYKHWNILARHKNPVSPLWHFASLDIVIAVMTKICKNYCSSTDPQNLVIRIIMQSSIA